MDDVNAMISQENWYKRDIVDPAPDDGPLVFDERQIDLIASVLGSEIARLQDRCRNSQDTITGGQLPESTDRKIARRLSVR